MRTSVAVAIHNILVVVFCPSLSPPDFTVMICIPLEHVFALLQSRAAFFLFPLLCALTPMSSSTPTLTVLTVEDNVDIKELAEALDIETEDLTKEKLLPLIKVAFATKRKAKEEAAAADKRRRLNEVYAIAVKDPLFEPLPPLFGGSIFGGSSEAQFHTLFVSDSNTIDNVKGQLQQILNISPKRFFLSFNGVQLEEGTRTLDDYNIRQGQEAPTSRRSLITLQCALHQFDWSPGQAVVEAQKERTIKQQLRVEVNKDTSTGDGTADSVFGSAKRGRGRRS
jgi:hypothetical protein